MTRVDDIAPGHSRKFRHRILWNRRPKNDSDCGDIDEIVIRNPAAVHVEQMDARCWWIGIDLPDGSQWCGNFVANSRGVMSFGQQENAGVVFDVDDSHGESA